MKYLLFSKKIGLPHHQKRLTLLKNEWNHTLHRIHNPPEAGSIEPIDAQTKPRVHHHSRERKTPNPNGLRKGHKVQPTTTDFPRDVLGQASTRLETLLLSEPDMIAAGVTDMPACVDAMVEMFRSLAVSDYRMGGGNANSHGSMVLFPEESEHPRMPISTPDRRFMAMPAYLGGKYHLAGCKWYGSNIENRGAGLPRSIHTFILNDADTGAPLAIMNGNLLSAYRTGAVSGVGARYLAKKDSRIAAIVGPGVMGKTALEAFAAGCPTLNTVRVKGRSQKGIDDFVTWIESDLPQFTTIEVVDSEQEALDGADVIAYTTTAPVGSANYPMIKPEWISPGAFVSMPSCVNIPDDFLTAKAKLVVDNTGLYECWIDEFGPEAFETVGIIGTKFLQMEKAGQLF